MSKKDNSENKEPWEQPIYNTQYSTSESRTEQRKGHKGHKSWYGTAFIILLLLIIGGALTIYFFMSRDKEKDDRANESTSQSSLISDTTDTASSSTQDSDLSTPSSSSSASSSSTTPSSSSSSQASSTTPSSTTPSSSQQQAVTGDTYTVQAGDNLYRIALNNGLTTEQLATLNGITADTPLSIGQILKLK